MLLHLAPGLQAQRRGVDLLVGLHGQGGVALALGLRGETELVGARVEQQVQLAAGATRHPGLREGATDVIDDLAGRARGAVSPDGVPPGLVERQDGLLGPSGGDGRRRHRGGMEQQQGERYQRQAHGGFRAGFARSLQSKAQANSLPLGPGDSSVATGPRRRGPWTTSAVRLNYGEAGQDAARVFTSARTCLRACSSSLPVDVVKYSPPPASAAFLSRLLSMPKPIP